MCPVLSDPANGSVQLSGRGVGSTANYSCVAGFTLAGEPQLECQPDGQWDPSPPNCESKQVIQFVNPRNQPILQNNIRDSGPQSDLCAS